MRKLIIGLILGLLIGSTALTVAGLVNKPFTFQALQPARSAEVNANFDALYNEFNGNITNSNISTSAAIVYSKLALTGNIVNADIANGAAIDRSKLNLTGGIFAADLAAGLVQPTSSGFLTGTGRRIICGVGLTGCGDFSSDRTMSVVDNTTVQKVLWGTDFDCCVPRRWAAFLSSSEITTGLSDDPGSDRVVFQSSIVAGSIANSKLKTATGSAAISGSSDTNVNMNDYAFFPSITSDVNGPVHVDTQGNVSDPGDTVARFRILNSTGTVTIRWRYITASRPPELVVVKNRFTGDVIAVWHSQIDVPGESPITMDNPDAETVYIAKFPDALLTTDAKLILGDLESGKLRLGCKSSDYGRLMTEAASKGRLVYKGAKLCEVS